MSTAMEKDPGSFLQFDKLSVKPPIATNSVKNFDLSIVSQDAASTRIIWTPLQHKLAYGSQYEKNLYSSTAPQAEIARLIAKRPLVFMGASDFTVLRDGTRLQHATVEWDRNGAEAQQLNKTLNIQDYLTYDEIMLSSLIGISEPSHFTNDGNRYNQGKPGVSGTFEDREIIVGLVRARFERRDRMDSIFCHPFDAAPDIPELLRRPDGSATSEKFEFSMYKARMRITIDIPLLEANEWAQEAGRTPYTYVVGLGLGVWQHNASQPEHYIDTSTDALTELSLPHISTLAFAWINVPAACRERVEKAAEKQGIKVVFSKRNPAERLDTKELLVLSYAWDGNAFQGNEYWAGSLAGSGGPAAACMSTIGELHNPLVNPRFLDRVKLLGVEQTNGGAL